MHQNQFRKGLLRDENVLRGRALFFRVLLSLVLASGLVIVPAPVASNAHGGGLDSNGGHNCRVGACAGTYHCHQPWGGVCASSNQSAGEEPILSQELLELLDRALQNGQLPKPVVTSLPTYSVPVAPPTGNKWDEILGGLSSQSDNERAGKSSLENAFAETSQSRSQDYRKGDAQSDSNEGSRALVLLIVAIGVPLLFIAARSRNK